MYAYTSSNSERIKGDFKEAIGNMYLHWTVSIILLLTDGGTPLDAMQR